jgi:hypothetical protein
VWQRLLVVECRVPDNYIRRMVGLMQASSSVSLFFFLGDQTLAEYHSMSWTILRVAL